jgi:hypothetical protein
VKININNTKTLHKVLHALEGHDHPDKVEILSQLLIKILILHKIKKEVFIDFMSECYDALEENANSLGFI